MRSAILLLVLSAAILGSCTSAYKTGQTPDDVYYSPERYQDKYVNVKEDNNDRYQDYSYDDQYLRMKVHNRVMWSELDDPYFYHLGYSYGSYYSWGSLWNPYTSWNYYYNPYCSPVIYTPKTVIAYNHPRVFNLNSYSNPQVTNSNYANPKGGGLYNSNSSYGGKPVRMVGYTPSNNNSNSGAGNFLRNIFNGSSNSSSGNSNSSFSSGSRSSGSSSGSSGSSGGGGGGSAPVRRF